MSTKALERPSSSFSVWKGFCSNKRPFQALCRLVNAYQGPLELQVLETSSAAVIWARPYDPALGARMVRRKKQYILN